MFSEQEHQDLLKSIFPVGQERWVKVKYTDFEKAKKNLRIHFRPNEDENELGFEVTALGCRDEYTPQVSALLDVKDAISMLVMDEETNRRLRSIIDDKISEIKQRTITTTMPND